MIYITGDTHGDFKQLYDYCVHTPMTEDDTIIILGDAGINYYGDMKDLLLKETIRRHIPATLFIIHGNHEMNPEYMDTCKTKVYKEGEVFYEPEFPNIVYAKDGEVYNMDGHQTICLGGAYSVDKYYRLQRGWNWFPDEQMSPEVKKRCEDKLKSLDNKIDVVLSHTTPYKFMPTDMFLSNIDQSTVDSSMEHWLQDICNTITYNHWFAGHFHCDRTVGNLTIMFNGIEQFTNRL